MGLLDSAMQSDSEFTADTDQFGETVTYTRLAGTSTTPTVIIDRNPPTRDPSFGANTRTVDVWIPYDSGNTFGLSTRPSTGDKIAMKIDPADASTVDATYYSMISFDSAGWMVEFRL